MKWFKHLTGSLNNSIIFEAIEKFGGDGYLVFFGTLELMADEYDIFNPGENTFSLKKLSKNLQISRRKLVKILHFFDRKASEYREKSKKNVSLCATINGDTVELNCPRLRELCDEYTQKQITKLSRQDPDTDLDKLRPKKEKERKKEKESIKEGKETKAFSLPTSNEINEGSSKLIDEKLAKITKQLYEDKIFPTVYPFLNTALKNNKNKKAILHTLTRCYLKRTFDKPGGAMAYCVQILKVENGNFNERDHSKSLPEKG